MPGKSKKPLIPHRVMLVGEEQIPRQIIEDLGEAHMQIFMREPDPREWPEAMQHLVGYLPPEEQIGFLVCAVLASHNDLLQDTVCRWTGKVWDEVRKAVEITSYSRELVIAEMARHVGEMVATCVPDLEKHDV